MNKSGFISLLRGVARLYNHESDDTQREHARKHLPGNNQSSIEVALIFFGRVMYTGRTPDFLEAQEVLEAAWEEFQAHLKTAKV